MNKIPVRQITTSHNEQINSGRFSIRDLKELLGGHHLVQKLHKHDFFFILAVEKGKGIHEIDFTRYNIKDGSIFILRPRQVHQLELKADCTGFLLEFDRGFYHPKDITRSQRLRRASSKNVCEFRVTAVEKLFYVLSYIFNEFTSKQEGYIDVIKANLDIFFIEFIRQSQGSYGASKNISSYSQDRFEELLELLETNITNLKSVSQYAHLLNLSTYQLNAITKATIGKPASELINEQIILEAKRYLLATPNQVKDIADHLGYEDTSYFIRFFKKHIGYSPEAFRKNFQ